MGMIFKKIAIDLISQSVKISKGPGIMPKLQYTDLQMKKGNFVWFFLSPILKMHCTMGCIHLGYNTGLYDTRPKLDCRKSPKPFHYRNSGSKHTSIMFTQWCGDGFFKRPAFICGRICRKVRGSIVIEVEHWLTATESRLDCDIFGCWFYKPPIMSTWWPIDTCCELWLNRRNL